MGEGIIVRKGGTAPLIIPGQEIITGEYSETIERFDSVNGFFVPAFPETSNWDSSFTRLNNPPSQAGWRPWDVSFTSDANYLATGDSSGANSLYLWKRDGDTFTKLTQLHSVGTVYGVNFSRDSVYLAVAIWSNPNILIFKRNGDTFTKLPDPATLPTGPSNKIKFSDDGTYLAVVHGNSPGITIYKRSGDTFTKLANPAILPPSTANNVDFSPDGTYLAVAHANSPFITIYKRNGDTFTKINNPSILPTSTARGCSFAMNPSNILDNSLYFATTHYGSPFVTIYKKENNTDNFIKLVNPDILPHNIENSDQFCKFDSTATFLGVGQDRTPGFRIYKRSGDTFTKLTDPASFQNTYGMTLDFSDNNGYLAIAKAEGGSGLTLYKTTLTPASNSFTKISKANNDLNLVVSTIEMTESAGYALEDGTAGQTKTMMSLFRKEE